MKKYTKIGIKLLSFFLTATFFAVTERLPVLSTVQNTGGVCLCRQYQRAGQSSASTRCS